MAASPPPDDLSGLTIQWADVYHPEWDDAPQAYVEAGIVAEGRSRRLARAEDATRAFKAYLGVQHWDPSRWNLPGEARVVFFVSLFHHNRTTSLRTYPTIPAALAALDDTWQSLA